jgi:hypothetical protein
VFTLLSYLKPGAHEEMSDVVPHHITDPEQQVCVWGGGGWGVLHCLMDCRGRLQSAVCSG